jgi:vancomycin resistance protein VanW
MVLHTPLTIVEHHHHDGFDLFPDYNRQVPFGTGTSILYNYLDYRFKNETDVTYQLITYVTDTHLCGELRACAELPVKYHIATENEHFVRVDGTVYRRGQVYRTCIDKATGNELSRELIRDNNAKVMYDTSNLVIKNV